MSILRTLRIRDLAIIDDLTVEFGPGLNLLTGETGAGKSIVVDALGLVAGSRADRSVIRAGAERAVVEALFEVESGSALPRFAAEAGFDALEDGELVVRREIAQNGTGRVRVNGSPCTVQMLREIGERLIELHGQHDQQGLLAPGRQLELLDRYGGHGEAVEHVAAAYDGVQAAASEVERLGELSHGRAARAEILAQTIREIEALGPRAGELDELARRGRLLRDAGRVAELLEQAVGLATEGEPSAAGLAAAAAARAERLAEFDPVLGDLASRLRSAAVEIEDAGGSLRAYRDRADCDPAGLEDLEARRAALERLCLRHGADEAGLLARLADARQELAQLDSLDGALAAAARDLAEARERYVEAATTLGRARRSAARRLSPALEEQLRHLALERARLEVGLHAARDRSAAGPEGVAVPLNRRGAERAELRLAANPGEPPRPLSEVASGGELSRVMLALLVVAGASAERRVLVFDEVDAGIGGAVADAVGARLAEIARRHQVLCVTHLPQIAAYADEHYHVRKEVAAGRTRTEIGRLARAMRVEELARMLAGRQPTAASRRHATELLGAAGRQRSAPAPEERTT